MDPTTVIEFGNKYGWAPVLLFGALWILLRFLRQVKAGAVFAWGQLWPLAKAAGEKHIETLNKVGATQEAIIEKLTAMDRGEKIDAIHEAALRAKCEYKPPQSNQPK